MKIDQIPGSSKISNYEKETGITPIITLIEQVKDVKEDRYSFNFWKKSEVQNDDTKIKIEEKQNLKIGELNIGKLLVVVTTFVVFM